MTDMMGYLKLPIIIIEIERSIGTKESFKISLLVYTLKILLHPNSSLAFMILVIDYAQIYYIILCISY